MQPTFHKNTLSAQRDALKGSKLPRTDTGEPSVALQKRGRALVPVRHRAHVRKAQLASAVDFRAKAFLSGSGHSSGFDPGLWPLTTCGGGRQSGTMLLVLPFATAGGRWNNEMVLGGSTKVAFPEGVIFRRPTSGRRSGTRS